MTIDIDKLRDALMDYYGTAINSGFPMAVIELGGVSSDSPEELINMAKQIGMDLRDFEIDDFER